MRTTVDTTTFLRGTFHAFAHPDDVEPVKNCPDLQLLLDHRAQTARALREALVVSISKHTFAGRSHRAFPRGTVRRRLTVGYAFDGFGWELAERAAEHRLAVENVEKMWEREMKPC